MEIITVKILQTDLDEFIIVEDGCFDFEIRLSATKLKEWQNKIKAYNDLQQEIRELRDLVYAR